MVDIETIPDGCNEDDYLQVSEVDYDSDTDAEETFIQRVQALNEIIPWSIRRNVGQIASRAKENTSKMLCAIGNVAWMATTSILLVGLPLFVEYDREHNDNADMAKPHVPLMAE